MVYHYSVSASSLLESELHANNSQHPPRHEVYPNNETKVHTSIKPCSVSTIQLGRCSSEPMTSGCHLYRIASKRKTMVVPSGIEFSNVLQFSFVPFSTLSLYYICPVPPITFTLLLATAMQQGARLYCMISRQVVFAVCSSFV